jgi:hypothetical protein
MWNDSLDASSLMVSNFTNLKIMTFTDSGGTDCPTSCAVSSSNYIKLDDTAPFQPQSRILHEMGHIAAYKANAHVTTSDYCYPNFAPCTGGGWSLAGGAEWRDPQFEEGLATFFGDRALYWSNADAPHTCLSPSFCPSGSFNVETSLGSSCVFTGSDPDDRRVLQVVRFLRDLYDSVADSAEICAGEICTERTDLVTQGFGDFFGTYNAYPSCFGDHCDDEPWNTNWIGSWYIDDRDGRSGSDFKYHFENETTWDATDPYALNCEP